MLELHHAERRVTDRIWKEKSWCMHLKILVLNAFLSRKKQNVSLVCMFLKQHNQCVWCTFEAALSSMYVQLQSNLFFYCRLHVWQTCSAVIFNILSHVSSKWCECVCVPTCINCLSVQVAELHWQAPMKTHPMYVHVSVCVMTLSYCGEGVFKCFVNLSFFSTDCFVPEKKNKKKMLKFLHHLKGHIKKGKLFSYMCCICFTWTIMKRNHSCILLV